MLSNAPATTVSSQVSLWHATVTRPHFRESRFTQVMTTGKMSTKVRKIVASGIIPSRRKLI